MDTVFHPASSVIQAETVPDAWGPMTEKDWIDALPSVVAQVKVSLLETTNA